MNPETTKQELKRITDEALGIENSSVEATLERGEYYIQTEVWSITAEQLDKIRSQVTITSLSVDGGKIMLTAKKKNSTISIGEDSSRHRRRRRVGLSIHRWDSNQETENQETK